MAADSRSSFWRWFRRILFVLCILFTVFILSGLIYLKTRPMPSKQKLAAADRRHRQVRAMFPDFGSDEKDARATLAVSLGDLNSSQTLQFLCDKLGQSIICANYGYDGWDILAHGTDQKKILAQIDAARGLVTYYDKGVRVSRQIRDQFKPENRYVIGSLADMLADTTSPLFAARFNSTVQALKFLRVLGCPSSGLPDHGLFNEALTPQGNNLAPLPKELADFDLNLLAPKEALDWNRYIAQELDYYQHFRSGTQRLLNPGYVYHYVQFGIGHSTLPDTWYRKGIGIVTGGIGAVIAPPLEIAPRVEEQLRFEKSLQDYAASYARHQIPAEIPVDVAIQFSTNDQLRSRLIAGAIELRRGAPIPTPDKIGPDSYFFDSILQKPYSLYVSYEAAGLAHLHIVRYIKPYPDPHGKGQRNQCGGWGLYIPLNHPGLENVPKK